MKYHTPALLQRTITALQIKSGNTYIDATLGGGGHTKAILDKGGMVLGIDQDQEALDFVAENLSVEINNSKLITAKGNFKDIKRIAQENKFTEVDGILFDLGVSSHQFDKSERGFSIKGSAPLDMRMDRAQKLTAYDVVNFYSHEDLVFIFQKYGEEEYADKIAEEIIKTRNNRKIETTEELVNIIVSSGGKKRGIHPATRVFQAIRIEVNAEMESIKKALPEALSLLKKNGRIAVISFHSLEDRIVKMTFDMWHMQKYGQIITKKPIIADEDEVVSNPRARSAKLRIFEKI